VVTATFLSWSDDCYLRLDDDAVCSRENEQVGNAIRVDELEGRVWGEQQPPPQPQRLPADAQRDGGAHGGVAPRSPSTRLPGDRIREKRRSRPRDQV